jgi:hypothetical protein
MLVVGIAAVIWSIWKTRNSACFEKKYPDEPCEVIFKICHHINCRSSLQAKEDVKNRLVFCAKLLEKVVKDVFEVRRC